jgi:serine/threonine protein phosphatase PrpC
MARLELFARTEVGCVRERNEDAFLVASLTTGEGGLGSGTRVQELEAASGLVGVCDGMGGAASGDLASQMATEQLAITMRAAMPFADSGAVQSALLRSTGAANRAIRQFANANPTKKGMGTTMTAAVVFGSDLHVVHIGDSRAYVRRGRRLQQLTTDHSVVGQMVASGKLTDEEARNYEHRNVLLQALGVQEAISPQLVIAPIAAGDVLLLCSDGLTGPLTDAQVLDLLLQHEDPMRACRALTEAACAAGGPDNVTVAVVRFVGAGLPVVEGPAAIQFSTSHTR